MVGVVVVGGSDGVAVKIAKTIQEFFETSNIIVRENASEGYYEVEIEGYKEPFIVFFDEVYEHAFMLRMETNSMKWIVPLRYSEREGKGIFL